MSRNTILAGLSAVALASGVFAVSTAQATAPGRNGADAFVQIGMIATLDRGNYRILTPAGGDNRHPRWSQDGKRLVFHTGSGAIKTVLPNGTGLRTVLPAGGFDATWQSPTRIAFVKTVAGKRDIYSIAATGGAVKRLTRDGSANCGSYQPAFSADGRYLAYLQDQPVAGSCASPTKVVKIVDQRTGWSRVIKQVADIGPNDPGYGPHLIDADRLDFTADSQQLVFKVVYDGSCVQLWAVVSIRSAAYNFYQTYDCEGDPVIDAAVPMPDGSMKEYRSGPDTDHDVQPLLR